MTRKELLQKVQELERRVRDLEARPVYVPVPVQPQPYSPAWPTYPVITYSGQSNIIGIQDGHQVWN